MSIKKVNIVICSGSRSLCEFSHAPQPLHASLKHFLALVISLLDCDWLPTVAADLITGPHEGKTQS